MSMWLSQSSLMRPSIPDWLEDIGQKLTDDDPSLTTLELIHQRIDDAQARFLARALQDNTRVTVFVLSCYAIVDDGALALAEVLRKNRSIKKLQLRDLRNSREVMVFFGALSRNKTIEEFSLRHSQICARSAQLLYDVVAMQPSFREVRLIDTQLVGGSITQICNGLQCNTSLHRLYLVNTEFEPVSGAEALCSMLKKNCNLRELYACENELGDDGTVALTEGLLENSSLQKLDLRSNQIGLEGALSLENLVKASSSLVGLYLGANEIGNIGAEAIAQGLQFCTVLQTLDLSNNGIDAKGAAALAAMLVTNTGIEELNLSFNSIGDEGATSIANVLDSNVTLKCLSLRRNNISNKGAYAIAAKLPRMRGLKELIMIKNNINHAGADALLQGLRRNMELEYLHVEDKIMSEPILREIFHWIRLNRAGRRVFRYTNLPTTVWPQVLSRVNSDMDVLYHFLTEKPDLFQHFQATQGRFCTLLG